MDWNAISSLLRYDDNEMDALDATLEANNYVEVYHSKLKSKSRNLGVDRIILILATQMVNDYRWATMMVNDGTDEPTLTTNELKSKKGALRNPHLYCNSNGYMS
ncbi:unnamed protein product [Absidia cylindrospora]